MNKRTTKISPATPENGWEIVPMKGTDLGFRRHEFKKWVYQGYGFFDKNYTKEKKIYLVRCPDCMRENYAMSVASGQCAWCGFNANKLLIS